MTEPENIAAVLAAAARGTPGAVAVTDLDAPGGRRDIRYGELWEGVLRTAAALRGLGVAPGERVAMLLPNSWEYVQCFLGAAAAGVVIVPMNVRLLQDELLHILRDSGARALIVQHALLKERPALAGVAALGEIVVHPEGQLGTGQRAFEAFAAATGLVADALVEPEALAAILYTSGTTGLPKGVMLPHRAWRTVGDYACRLLSFGPDEVTLHSAALTHGSGFLLLGTMAVGGRALICRKFDGPRILGLLATERVTSGFMVPSMIQMLLDAATDGVPVHAPALRSLYYAGSPIDPATLRDALERFGDALVQSFAQTEIPMFLTVLTREEHRRIADGDAQLLRSAGRIVDGVRLRIVDDDGRDVPPGEAGEIVAQGPHMMLGYWNRPEATGQAIVDGWLHTGDVGRVDADGYLYVMDRKKDMIISGGSNVYAREVEDVLLRCPGVREAAVIGLPHPKWGEMVTAVMVPGQGGPVAEADLDRFARDHLADYRRPKAYIWVDTLPRNAYGKVLKRDLRDRFSNLAARAAAKA